MDREKVIKGLYQHCKGSMFDRCGECPYYDVDHENGFVCRDELLSDVLELLKEQEPVKPKYEDFFGNPIASCGYCNGYIVRYKFCPGCGKEVQW